MQNSIIILGIIQSLLTLLSILWVLWGIFILISGKMKFPKPKLEGKNARTASLIIILPFLLALLISFLFHEGLDLGKSTAEKALQSAVINSIIYLLFLILSFTFCRSYAKSKK